VQLFSAEEMAWLDIIAYIIRLIYKIHTILCKHKKKKKYLPFLRRHHSFYFFFPFTLIIALLEN